MNYAIEGIYKDGNIELIEMPQFPKPVGVKVIFLENKKEIRKLRGLFKNYDVDYDKMGLDLKELERNCSAHILDKAEKPIQYGYFGNSQTRRYRWRWIG